MIRKVMPLSIAAIVLACPALAEKMEMTCKNPRQGYAVTFDDMTRTIVVGAPGGDTPYMVESVEKGAGGPVVKGKTVNDGPGFVAYLGGKKRMEFVDGGQVIQTDLCE